MRKTRAAHRPSGAMWTARFNGSGVCRRTSGVQSWQSCDGASDMHPGSFQTCGGGLLQGMPASFYGTNGPSHEEWAVYLALTLYALHQQSNDTVCVSQLGCTLGRAVRRLAEQTVASGQDWTESSILRRFNALATAEEITEISHHLRGMIQLLRAAKPDSIPLDYPRLAVDLYGLQCDAPQLAQLPANIRLRWGQDLYRYEKNESSETQEKEN